MSLFSSFRVVKQSSGFCLKIQGNPQNLMVYRHFPDYLIAYLIAIWGVNPSFPDIILLVISYPLYVIISLLYPYYIPVISLLYPDVSCLNPNFGTQIHHKSTLNPYLW